jgi:hypothetical protein
MRKQDLGYNGLFHEPESWDELLDWIDRHNSADRPHLLSSAGMAANMTAAHAVKLHNSIKESDNG